MTTTLPVPTSSQIRPEIGSFQGHSLAIGRIRAFVTALVVAHHAVLAYHPWAPPHDSLLTQPRWWQAFPTADPQKWTGWALFTGFNDVFFMALMFFISGLFVWSSLERKGAGRFVRDRLVRLGLPFLLLAGLLAPIAYYPAYLQCAPAPTLADYCRQWFALGNWPAGPGWFLWVLLALGCLAAAVYKLAPRALPSVNHFAAPLLRRPAAFFVALAALSALAYAPMALALNPLRWTTWGPFTFQTSRIIHYALYFAAGAIVGAATGERSLLSPTGPLAKRWILWPIAALLAFVAVIAITIAAATNPAHPRSLDIIGAIGFSVSCAASSFACLALFLRFARSPRPLIDNFSACAYGVFIIHYPIVNWLQHALLGAQLSGVVKGAIAIVAGLALSWWAVYILCATREKLACHP